MPQTDKIKQLISASIATKQQLLQDEPLLKLIAAIADKIVESFRNGHRLYFCGNGGSAADAQHLAAEFSGRFYKDRPALPAEAPALQYIPITAVANDYSFDVVYARLIEGIGEAGDVLVGISTSGNSAQHRQRLCIRPQQRSHYRWVYRHFRGKMKACSDYLINIPSTDTPRIQESHILVGHIICQLAEEKYFG